MANMKSLAKDTAIYGLSSIVGRFLNYLLVPLYTHYMPKDSGDYGISTNMYAYTALILVLLTFGMETTLFRFANDEAPSDAQQGKRWPDTVFTTSFAVVGTLTAIFLILLFSFITPISNALGYEKHPDYLLMMGVVVALDALQAIPFSYLRFQKRPIRFASLKLLFIFMNIALNLIFFVWLGKTSVFYVFFLNLLCTGFITFFFIPDLLHIQWHFDGKLLRRMFSYSWPILVLGVAGILNQVADKILFPLIFAKSKDADKGEYYAAAMKYFLIFTLLAFICVIGWMPVLKYIIGSGYREGLGVVPIVMAAEIMMGIYFNLSFWYKLIDKTIYGAWFSLAGCLVLLAVNILLIPKYSYWACAWGGVAGYGTSMLLSYFVGQKKNPIPYPMKEIGCYVLLAAFISFMILFFKDRLAWWLTLIINTAWIMVFVAYIIKHDLPLANIPVIGKYFKKQNK